MNDRGLSAAVRGMSLDDRGGRSNNTGAAAKKITSRVQFRNTSGPASTSYGDGGRDRSSTSSSSASLVLPSSTGAAAAALRAPPRDVPIFALETLERNANRGGGSITTGAAANNCVIVGTSRGTCIFYDFADGTSVEVDCAVSLSSSSSSAAGAGAAGGRGGAGGLGLGLAHKWQQQQHHHQQHSSSSSPPPDVAIGRVWLDPTARHAIATLHDGLNRPVAAVYFRPAVDAKARPLRVPLSSSTSSSSSSSSSAAAAAKEKESGDGRSMDVTAVGWHAARCTDVAAADILVGTADGALYELSLDASTADASSGSKKSSSSSSSVVRVFRKVLELTEVREPVAGLYVDCVEGQYTVLAATATRLYCFTGGDTLEATLTGPGGRGPRGGGAEALVEMPVEAGRHHFLHSRHHISVTNAVAR